MGKSDSVLEMLKDLFVSLALIFFENKSIWVGDQNEINSCLSHLLTLLLLINTFKPR